MIYSPLIQKAISFATQVHETEARQKRKGKDIPYIVHPLTVGLILSRVTKDEEIIAAGILHDTIEDCVPPGSVTKASLKEAFGKRVAGIVDDLTEQDKKLPWSVRKRKALEYIKAMNKDSLLAKGADVLHNLNELIDDLRSEGESAFERFNAPKEAQIERYRKLIAEIQAAWSKHPLLQDLQLQFERLLEKIKG